MEKIIAYLLLVCVMGIIVYLLNFPLQSKEG